jgi:hypothetical protein
MCIMQEVILPTLLLRVVADVYVALGASLNCAFSKITSMITNRQNIVFLFNHL